MKKALILFLSISILAPLGAQSFRSAAGIAKKDLTDSLKELSQLRDTIQTERIPLAEQMERLETELIGKRKEAERTRKLVDNEQYDLNSMEDRAVKLGDNNAYLGSLLGDYIRRFETQVHIAELQLYEEILKSSRLAMEDVNITDAEKFQQQLIVLEKAFARMDETIGGQIFKGKAVVAGGLYEDGQYAIVGPVAFFTSGHSEQVGLANLRLGSINAVIASLDAKFHAGIRSLTDTAGGSIPLDATLGDASKMDLMKESFIEHIKKGGVVMIPILGLAGFALIIAIFKWFEISGVRRARARDLDTILRHLRHGQKDDAMAYAKGVKGPVGEMLSAAVEHSDEDKDLIEEVLYEKIIITQPKLERMLPLIAVTAATAPLLGLLGTVTGMIKTFKLITVFGTGDAKSLSSGISEALITTEFGLIIAIPALILHAMLSRKAKGVVGSMEQTAVGFINGLNSPTKES